MERGLNMKKVLFLITLFFAMLFATSTFAIEGEGTEESPFLITTQEELLLINDFPDCHFKLMNNIELQGDWVPLCTYCDGFTGAFDGNGKTISNLTITENYAKIGLFSQNDGTIINTNVFTSNKGISIEFDTENKNYIGVITAINNGCLENCTTKSNMTYKNDSYILASPNKVYIGAVTGYNNGYILKCKSTCAINASLYHLKSYSTSTQWGADCYIGGLTGYNSNVVSLSSTYGSISVTDGSRIYVGGISGLLTNGKILNCYSNMNFDANAYSVLSGGLIGLSDGMNSTTENCYVSVVNLSGGEKYGLGYHNKGNVINCFYDTTVSGLTDTDYGTPKGTLAMKMKKTYSDAGWDFDNVWGISSNINNGYPYLLWEYVDNSSANTEIIGVTSTDNSLKFISEVQIEGTPEISTFGTAFIPLWLFETGSTDTATVSYDNSKYNIQGGQTFGATLTGIPESCKNMEIVGKSFIKDTDGNYTWSTAKYSSVDDTILNSLE